MEKADVFTLYEKAEKKVQAIMQELGGLSMLIEKLKYATGEDERVVGVENGFKAVTITDGEGNVYLRDLGDQNVKVLALSSEVVEVLGEKSFYWLKKLLRLSTSELMKNHGIEELTLAIIAEQLRLYGLSFGMSEDDVDEYQQKVHELCIKERMEV